MKSYEKYLCSLGKEVLYVESTDNKSNTTNLLNSLINEGLSELHVLDTVDNWLDKKIKNASKDIELNTYKNPGFINSEEDLTSFFKPGKTSFFQTTFYKKERKRLDLMMKNGDPIGGKWTYDGENRLKYPKDKTPPKIDPLNPNSAWKEAIDYIELNFENNLGELSPKFRYPTDFKESKSWFNDFLQNRFEEFGPYEDAVVKKESFLNHSVLSPLINSGLLSPEYVVKKAISFATENEIPLNSLEGFVRQIIGWREFIRGVYVHSGTKERTTNFWKHDRKIPPSFYDGTTGILPIDNTIKKILKTGYAHHIERLMILGNFMLLCEFDPDEVYQWFMELFIDAYDWVMVPNVYGMTLFADGGVMSTKPYISGSNYIKKMSDYENGEWQKVWNGLFWNFMVKHRDYLSKNPRLNMLLSSIDRMSSEKLTGHLEVAKEFLKNLENPKSEGQLELL